eukprot:Selendium_serpulae@DN914_c0_g1_i1.p1
MIDSGSQLNLIDLSILPLLKHKAKQFHVKTFRGVGAGGGVKKWVQFIIVLPNGESSQVTAGVTENRPCSILLGVPFLKAFSATVDHATETLTTRRGPIKLRVPKRMPATFAGMVSREECPVEE